MRTRPAARSSLPRQQQPQKGASAAAQLAAVSPAQPRRRPPGFPVRGTRFLLAVRGLAIMSVNSAWFQSHWSTGNISSCVCFPYTLAISFL